ncbi:MAG: UbiA family prenyltransferase [Planctomycetota bacterium]
MSRVRAYLELVRAPNLFTAIADSLAGYWLCTGAINFTWRTGLILASSACLYAYGIVLNDLMDDETDRQERPSRPLPSGRINTLTARTICAASLAFGILLALGAGVSLENPDHIDMRLAPTLVALAIAFCIAAYDCLLKETWLGPAAMGACRGLNVLLGMSVAGSLAWDIRMAAPLAMFIYVASFTAFGRTETQSTPRRSLTIGTAGVIAGLLVLGVLAAHRIAEETFTLVLWLAFLIHMGRVALRTIRHPQPRFVQYAMKTFILGIIAFDAIIASASHGWLAAVVLLLLLIPAGLLGRWVYST